MFSGKSDRTGSRWLAAVLTLLLTGCASNYGWHTEKADSDFVPGTRVLGELIMNPSRAEVLSGQGLFDGWRDKLIEAGYRDSDITDDSEVTVWSFCFGHNSGVPLCTHHGHYLVHLLPGQRQGLDFDDEGNAYEQGDLVEIELTTTASGVVIGRLVSVYRDASDWGDCRVAHLERAALSTTLSMLGGVGPPRANWLECDSAVDDGWRRKPVVGAPVSAVPVSQWIKSPMD